MNNPQRRRREARRHSRLWRLILVVVAAGCGRESEYGEVEGRVLSGGRPLSNIQVRFLPDPEAGSDGPEAAAITDATGRFRLRTERICRDGAVIGIHRVCLRPMTVPWKARLLGGTISVQRPDHEVGTTGLRGLSRFADPATTPFCRVQVWRGPQAYDFDVQRGTVNSTR